MLMPIILIPMVTIEKLELLLLSIIGGGRCGVCARVCVEHVCNITICYR